MTSHELDDVGYFEILKLAWPASIAASITPLLGAIDVWALGQSSNPLSIAAVGLAATIFSLAYWTFGFLRMSVAGLTAQASGAGDYEESRYIFMRGFVLACAIGFGLVILQLPIGKFSFWLLGIGSGASGDTFESARAYFYTRIWGAPFALATYVCLGWLTAKGRTDFLMITSVVMTLINAVLDILFVLKFDMGARGIAIGTLVAEIFGLLIGFSFVLYIAAQENIIRIKTDKENFLSIEKISQTLSISRDIFIRTVLLAFAFSWFIQRGSVYGDATLAANQLLLQLFLFTGLALDGTAIAAETLVGRIFGRARATLVQVQYNLVLRRTFVIAISVSLVFVLLYLIFGRGLISILSDSQEINSIAHTYLVWVIASPLIVMVSFQLDGVFVGATRSSEMRNSMIISVMIYVPFSLWAGSGFGNHGLWLAFSIFFIMRAMTLLMYMPRIRKALSV